jgi:hypothetical protein
VENAVGTDPLGETGVDVKEAAVEGPSKRRFRAGQGGVAADNVIQGETIYHFNVGSVAVGSNLSSINFEPAVHPGVTWGALSERAAERIQLCVKRRGDHDTSAHRWRRAADPLAWLTAVLAALSGITVVSDNLAVAPWLAVATALVAATNAALGPAETARKHRASALVYDKIRLKVEDFDFFELQSQNGSESVPEERRAEIRDALRAFDEEINTTAEASPPLRGM